MTVPDLKLASASTDELALLGKYSRAEARWTMPLKGHFWETIAAAHAEGLTGRGRRVAVIDSPPDTSYTALADVEVRALVPSGPHPHGTLVDLLIRTAAPDCALTHFGICRDGRPQPGALATALDAALSGSFDYVCMSLGAAQPMQPGANAELMPLIRKGDFVAAARQLAETDRDPPCVETCAYDHCFCAQIGAVDAEDMPVLITAAGNADELFCPARAPECLSIGFQTERRWFEDGHERREWHRPPYAQSGLLDYTLMQMEGALGSSFAAPLFAGALALREEPRPVRTLLRPNEVAGAAVLMEAEAARLRKSGKPVSAALAGALRQIYDLAFAGPGDVGIYDLSPSRRLEARLCYSSTVINAALVLLRCRQKEHVQAAIDMFEWCARLMPWHHSPRANLANACLSMAASPETFALGPAEALAKAAEARDIFAALVEQDAENEAFQAGLRDALTLTSGRDPGTAQI